MHQKISEMLREWPFPRKGRKYLSIASHEKNNSMSVLFALRDSLKLAKTRREVKRICLDKNVKINGKVRVDIDFPIQRDDILSLEKLRKDYKLVLKNKKFVFEEVKGKDAKTKISKVIDKRLLKNKIVQINLDDGTNRLIKTKIACGDSILVDLTKNEIIKIIPLTVGSNIEILSGKHIGKTGKIEKTETQGDGLAYRVNLEGGKEVLLNKETLKAIE